MLGLGLSASSMFRFLASVTIVALLVGAPFKATAGDEPTPYDQGKVRIGLSGGMVSAFGESYFAIHAGVGYFVLDGLETALDFEQWIGAGPSLTMLSPGLRYVLHMVPVAKPYVGGFYKHWFVGDEQPDLDTVGGRAGLHFSAGRAVIGAGVVGEWVVSECTEDCQYIYPEFGLFLSF